MTSLYPMGILFSSSSTGSQGWWFCNLVVILMSWEEVSTAFYSAILTGSLNNYLNGNISTDEITKCYSLLVISLL